MRSALDHWLALHCGALDGVLCGAVFFKRGSGLNPMSVWPQGSSAPPALLRAANACINLRQPVTVPVQQATPQPATVGGDEGAAPAAARQPARSAQLQVVAHPLQASGVMVGVVVVGLRGEQAPPAADLATLAAHADTFNQVLRPAGAPAPEAAVAPQATATARADARQAEMLKLAHAVFERPDYRSATTLLTSALAARFGCDRVTLGFRNAGLTQVEAVSDGSPIDVRRPVWAEIAAAMDEAMDEAASLVWPPAEGAPPRVLAAHAGLARRQGLVAVCSVPLVHAGQVVGALTLEQAVGRPPDAEQLALWENLALTVVPWLMSQREAEMPAARRLRRQLRSAWAAMAAPGHGTAKLSGLLGLVVLAALLVVPVSHEVRADARLEGRTQRALAAPGDGFIRQVFVRPGDSVSTGQVLVAFEGEDLRLEHQRLSAELAGEDAALGDAMQRNDRTRLAIASARVEELGAQRALVAQRLERAELKAPFDGVVIAGDLSQQLGAPVQRGAVLLTVAPADGLRAVVEVPDADIGPVQPGQRGSLVLTAWPERAFALSVARITPLANPSNGRQVFEVEVALDDPGAAALRPGMQGVARLRVGEQALALQWSRDALAWLRLLAWRWWG